MEIVIKTIRIIDYENNAVYVRETPETFSEYVSQLITYINGNTSIREYKTRSANTEVISCILDIVRNQIDEEYVTGKMDGNYYISLETEDGIVQRIWVGYIFTY